MAKSRNTGFYLGLAVVAIVVSLFIPEIHKDKTQTQIKYYPTNATKAVIYNVKEGSIQEIGDCITFLTDKEKPLTICGPYEKIEE